MGDWQIFFIPKTWWDEIHEAGEKGEYPTQCIFELNPFLYESLIANITSRFDPNCIRHLGIYAVEKDKAEVFQEWFKSHFIFRPRYLGLVKPDLTFVHSPSDFLNPEQPLF